MTFKSLYSIRPKDLIIRKLSFKDLNYTKAFFVAVKTGRLHAFSTFFNSHVPLLPFLPEINLLGLYHSRIVCLKKKLEKLLLVIVFASKFIVSRMCWRVDSVVLSWSWRWRLLIPYNLCASIVFWKFLFFINFFK